MQSFIIIEIHTCKHELTLSLGFCDCENQLHKYTVSKGQVGRCNAAQILETVWPKVIKGR